MAKMKTVYIWEGSDCITILRGTILEPHQTSDNRIVYNAKVKHKGVFNFKKIPVKNLDETYLGSPKKLAFGDKVLPGWEARKINIDYGSHEPYLNDVPPNLINRITKLQHELDIMSRKYFNAVSLNRDRETDDRFFEKTNKIFKQVGDAKSKIFEGGSMYGGYGFGSRWGLPSTPSYYDQQKRED